MSIPILTLTEYLQQANAVKMPIVVLNDNEYTIETQFAKPGGEIVSIIIINAYPDARYAQTGKNKRLFPINEDGIYNKPSCFWLSVSEPVQSRVFEYVVLSDHKTLITCLPQLADLTGVKMKLVDIVTKNGVTNYEYKVADVHNVIDVKKLKKEAP